MDELEPGPEPRSHHHNIGLFLALYLLILAFFIVLQSISQREEVRSAAALNSLTATFRAQALIAREAPQFTSSLAPHDPIEAFQREVRAVFARELPIARFRVLQLGNVMRVTVPVDDLFAPGEAALRPALAGLMEPIADALGRQAPGRRFEVEFIVGAGRALPPVGSGAGLEVRRAGALVRDLRTRGVSARALAAGGAPRDATQVEMLFSARREDEAGATFEQLLR